MEMAELNQRYKWYKINLPCYSPDEKVDFVFRGATRRELGMAGQLPDLYQSENYILTHCVANQLDWENVLGGSALKVLVEIQKLSGVDATGEVFKKSLIWMKDPDGALEAAAIVTIPSCTGEYLDTCDPEYYARTLLLGKLIFEFTFKMSPMQAFGDEKAPATEVSGDPVLPKRGEVGQRLEKGFSWKKGQKLNVNLDRSEERK
jgi:hypothetical protein